LREKLWKAGDCPETDVDNLRHVACFKHDKRGLAADIPGIHKQAYDSAGHRRLSAIKAGPPFARAYGVRYGVLSSEILKSRRAWRPRQFERELIRPRIGEGQA
jgi:hypothetical protein